MTIKTDQKYFVYDAEEGDFEIYESKDEAVAKAKEMVSKYIKEDSSEYIEIYWGKYWVQLSVMTRCLIGRIMMTIKEKLIEELKKGAQTDG